MANVQVLKNASVRYESFNIMIVLLEYPNFIKSYLKKHQIINKRLVIRKLNKNEFKIFFNCNKYKYLTDFE